MPFTDTISIVSGRNSRASNVSGITGASRSVRSQPIPQSDTLNAGVLSMLKTTTDTGDIGALSFNHHRLPTMPRAAHPRRGHNARHSGPSNPVGISSHHHYAPSQTSRVSSSREWDSASTQQRLGSLTSMQSMPPFLPPAHLGKAGLQMPAPCPDEARSYSMTSAPPAPPLPRHRSVASLKSQGHEPRHAQLRPGYAPPPMPENRPPYVYPTRLKRPGYRSPSPALSDGMVQGPPQTAPMGRRMAMPRPPPQAFNSGYAPDYNMDPRHLNVRPPPRTMSTSPVMGYNEPQQHFAYRNPAAMRSAPGLTMRPNPHWPHGPPPPPAHQQPMMHRPQYPGMPYPPRPGYALYGNPHYPGDRVPPMPINPEVAHHMFHNAARMARNLPSRTDTPLTGPPSSDPPSSGTAPTSSGPPTPKDQSTLQVAVDPAFIDPALLDLPDSSSEPALAHQYLRYAEGLEKDVHEPEIEAAHPSVPPSGFVQRVKAMLESKAAAEAAAMKENDREKTTQPAYYAEDVGHVHEVVLEDYVDEIHELAANETPRFTILEEFDAPVELPASPVKIAELAGSPIQMTKRRLTRDLVKAGLASSSVENTTVETEVSKRASIDMLVRHKPNTSRDTAIDVKIIQKNVHGHNEVPSTPEAVQRMQQQERSKAASETGSSPAIGLSAADYALRFDTTAVSDESRTEDPFMLDADTITLQHQRSKERMAKPPQHDEQPAREPCSRESAHDTPVSPILAGEDVSRFSAVSPLQTQTLGIDETLHLASEADEDDCTTTDDQTESLLPGDDTQPPPTPRTPKTYSKSVQLQPTGSKNDTPSSNRYSLPPDLSTVGDTTLNSNSEMLTDVAVRFSLPQTTVTVSRPQIIEIPPSSSPVREAVELKPSKQALQAPDFKSKRGSVMFADEVAPLNINKKQEQYSSSQKTTEGRPAATKSIIRRPSPLQENIDVSRASRGTSSDTSFSATGMTKRFGSTHLPGLKEESVEEMSIFDKRVTDLTGGFQFPLPARIAAVKAMQERRLQESGEKAKARRAARHPSRPLAEIRDLPSLNFSRMDLIDKLNEALDTRDVNTSKSMEIMRRREFSQIYCPSPQRPQSTEPLRERYTSFFSKPEDFSSFFDDALAQEESEREADLVAEQAIPAVEVQPSTELDLGDSASRPLSPEDFMNVATQVNRLSIPSVTALSDRLSDILPNLRELQLDSILADFEQVGEGLRLSNVRPETILSTRTSTGFRTLAERAEEIVKNGTHDSTVPTCRLLGMNKDLPPLPESMSADQMVANLIDSKTAYLSGSVSAPTDLCGGVSRPVSVLLRGKAPASKDEVETLLPPEMNPITRYGKRAMTISTASSRPWNQDENYPWSGSKVDVDLTVPSLAHTRRSTTGELLSERGTKSLDLTSSGDFTNTTRGIDIGSLLERNPTATLTDEQLTGVNIAHHLRKQSKRSVIGSITRKIGLSGLSECNPTRSLASPSAQSDLARSRSSQAHRPGERYPTSSLTPPAAFNLDEVRSFFSDDSSDKEHNASFRKRLTNLKGKGKTVRIDSTHHSFDGHTAYDPGEMKLERLGASSSANTYDAVGMGKTEFRIKRFGEKLRHLVARGGELFRSWSTRTKPQRTERVRDDWLSDSVYSGV